MKERGEVIALQEDVVTLKVIKKPECSGCKACFFGQGENSSTIKAKNTVEAKVGEHVYFTVQKDNKLKASLIVYILPILFMGLGVLIGALAFKKEAFIVLSAAVGLAIGFLALFLVDKCIAKSKNFQIELVGIVPEEELNATADCSSCSAESNAENMTQTEPIQINNEPFIEDSTDAILAEYLRTYNQPEPTILISDAEKDVRDMIESVEEKKLKNDENKGE